MYNKLCFRFSKCCRFSVGVLVIMTHLEKKGLATFKTERVNKRDHNNADNYCITCSVTTSQSMLYNN